MKCIKVNVLKERMFLIVTLLFDQYFNFCSSYTFGRIILKHTLNQILFLISSIQNLLPHR